MAEFEINGLEEIIKKLGDVADISSISSMMLEESVPALEKELKKECSLHRVTGALEQSIKATKTKRGNGGESYILVRPTGKDSEGVRNMEKLVHAQYGTSKQKATPIMEKAVNRAEKPVCEKMQEIMEREVSKVWKGT